MTDLIFYTNPMSRGQITRWMLEETGLPYETRILEYESTMKAPEFLAINPMGKVPALRHGDHVVTEAAAICMYLAEIAPQAGLAPAPGDPLRADYMRWMFFGAGTLEPAVITHFMGVETTDPAAYRRAGWGSFPRVIDVMQDHLSDGRRYWLGDAFSAVDVYIGAQLAFGLQFETLPKGGVFDSYVAGLKSRPAAIRADKIDAPAAG